MSELIGNIAFTLWCTLCLIGWILLLLIDLE